MYPLEEIKQVLGDDYNFKSSMSVDELKKVIESGIMPDDNVPVVLEVGNLDIEITIYSNEDDDSLYLGYFCCLRKDGVWDSYNDIFDAVNLDVPELEAEMYRVLAKYADEKNLSFFTQNDFYPKTTASTDQIYILYSCNEWKEHSSKRLIAASTDMSMLYTVIGNEILEGNMDYDGKTNKEGLTAFRKDFQKGCINLDSLNCGYVENTTNVQINELSQANEYSDIYSLLNSDDREYDLIVNGDNEELER